ncbi:MAG: hypothetical protein ACE5FT_06450 [Candidatus Nanoarchaeia archaeon]
MRYLPITMTLILLLAACAPTIVECWDGSEAKDLESCPEEPVPEPVAEPEPEPELSAHGEYAQPEARAEMREEMKEESAERLDIELEETEDARTAAAERLDLVEPVELSDAMTIDAPATTIHLFENKCVACMLEADVKFTREGKDSGFGFVMKYGEGLDPTFLYDRSTKMVRFRNVTYGEDFRMMEGELPDSFHMKLDVARDSVTFTVDDDDLLRESKVGTLAQGRGFGLVVKDATVQLSNVKYKLWRDE